MASPTSNAAIALTGASSGIGRALAVLLAPTARHLVLIARRKDRLEALADELRGMNPQLGVEVRPCDLADVTATRELAGVLAEHEPPIDVLINNAGVGDISCVDLADESRLKRMIDLNVTSLMLLTHALLPGMIERARGGVLNISSGFGLATMPGFAAYVGSKHFVTGFTESLRAEVVGLGVVVTQVCPGPVATEFEEQAGNFTGMKPPGIVESSAERCARSALRGFGRGKALVIPGITMRVLMFLNAITPRWFMRLLHRPIGKAFRNRQLAYLEANPKTAARPAPVGPATDAGADAVS